MTVSISGILLENKKVEVRHGPSSFSFKTAAPKDNRGDGSSFSPTDLVATALGSCILTTLAIWAEQHGLDLQGSEVQVEKHMVDNPRRIGKLPVVVHLPSRLSPTDQEKVERVAKACPVHRSIHPEIEAPIEVKFDR